jgi:hypothetical protein
MTTLSKTFLITLILSAFALSQGAPSKTQTNSSKPQATSATSQNGKNQKDAAAKSSHPSTMSGNHKDMMMGVAADKNQGPSTTHSGNMIGNHKDVMEGTAPAPAAGGKTQPATTPAASPAAQPAPAPSRPKK